MNFESLLTELREEILGSSSRLLERLQALKREYEEACNERNMENGNNVNYYLLSEFPSLERYLDRLLVDSASGGVSFVGNGSPENDKILLLATDGSLRKDDRGVVMGGAGVFFRQNSSLNVSAYLQFPLSSTQAEVSALLMALRRITAKTDIRRAILITDSQSLMHILLLLKTGPSMVQEQEVMPWMQNTFALSWLNTSLLQIKLLVRKMFSFRVVWGRSHREYQGGIAQQLNAGADELAVSATNVGYQALGHYSSLALQAQASLALDGASGVVEEGDLEQSGVDLLPFERDLERCILAAEEGGVLENSNEPLPAA